MSYINFHFYELFWRFFYPLLFSFLAFFFFSVYFPVLLYFIFIDIAKIPYLIINAPISGISSYLWLCTYLTIICVYIPLIIIQIYLFIRPSIVSPRSEWYILWLILIPYISIYIALKLLPHSLKLFLSPFINSMDRYIYWVPEFQNLNNLLILITIAIILSQFIPIFFLFLQFVYKEKAIIWYYAPYRHYIHYVIIIIIAIITPPDIWTLIITGLPLILILELTIILTLIVYRYTTGAHPPPGQQVGPPPGITR